MNNTVYLLFCDDCGVPKHITPYIIENYLQQAAVNYIYCDNCKHDNQLPNYLKKIAGDL